MTDSSKDSTGSAFLAVAVGNTNTRLGLVGDGQIIRSAVVATPDIEGIAQQAAEMTRPDESAELIMLASVSLSETDRIADALAHATGLRVVRFDDQTPIPMAHALPDPVTVGDDRLLVALGAFSKVNQACIVVDAGTAITCDFVDGQGVFHGGAILPGGQMMLDALHRGTSALPHVSIEDMPEPLEPFGKTTEFAMLLGVRASVRGAVRYLAERYAAFYEAYPQIVATGGDAERMFLGDDLVEAIVPDLQLIGIAAARDRLTGSDGGAGG